MCSGSRRTQRINAVQEDSDSNESAEEFFVGTIRESNGSITNDWNIDILINDKPIKIKLDTGAQCNVIPLAIYQSLTNEAPKKSTTKLVSYFGHKMKTIGRKTLLGRIKISYTLWNFKLSITM